MIHCYVKILWKNAHHSSKWCLQIDCFVQPAVPNPKDLYFTIINGKENYMFNSFAWKMTEKTVYQNSFDAALVLQKPVETPGTWSQASCFPLFPVFMLN